MLAIAAGVTFIMTTVMSMAGFIAHIQIADLGPPSLGSKALATAAGTVLGAWLSSEKLQADPLKRVIALVSLAVAQKTAWGLL